MGVESPIADGMITREIGVHALTADRDIGICRDPGEEVTKDAGHSPPVSRTSAMGAVAILVLMIYGLLNYWDTWQLLDRGALPSSDPSVVGEQKASEIHDGFSLQSHLVDEAVEFVR